MGVNIHPHLRIGARSISSPDLDIKPSNILVSWRHGKGNVLEILEVVLSDTGDTAKVLEGQCLDGVKLGNVYWRSLKPKLVILSTGKRTSSPSDLRWVLFNIPP